MPCSQAQALKRAFVATLASLGRKWGLEPGISRESPEADIIRAFRRLARKAGQGKGGERREEGRRQARKKARSKEQQLSNRLSDRLRQRLCCFPLYS